MKECNVSGKHQLRVERADKHVGGGGARGVDPDRQRLQPPSQPFASAQTGRLDAGTDLSIEKSKLVAMRGAPFAMAELHVVVPTALDAALPHVGGGVIVIRQVELLVEFVQALHHSVAVTAPIKQLGNCQERLAQTLA